MKRFERHCGAIAGEVGRATSSGAANAGRANSPRGSLPRYLPGTNVACVRLHPVSRPMSPVGKRLPAGTVPWFHLQLSLPGKRWHQQKYRW